MPTNVVEPRWTSGPLSLSGGGDSAHTVIPSDIDTVELTITVAAATDVDIEITQDPWEDILGNFLGQFRYQSVELNDLGGSGELRMNPIPAGQSFLDDPWKVADGFTIISHIAPEFPDAPRVGKLPTGLGDVQTVFGAIDSVSADVITFTQDPEFTLAAGELTLRRSHSAIASASLNWQAHTSLSGAITAVVTIEASRAIRIATTSGTGVISYSMTGLHGSQTKSDSFIANVESRPYAGHGLGVLAGASFLSAASVPNVITWSRSSEGSPRRAIITVPAVDFDVEGVKQYDKIFFSRHSVTGNGGVYTVRTVTGNVIEFYEGLRGSAGVDNPARQNALWTVSPSGAVITLEDYDELVLQLLTDVGDSYYKLQEASPGAFGNMLDSGPDANTDLDIGNVPHTIVEGPFGSSQAYTDTWAGDNLDGWAVASEAYTVGGWFKPATQDDEGLITKGSGTIGSPAAQDTWVALKSGGTIDFNARGPVLADPGTWVANTAYVTGDRVRPSSDDNNVHECEVAGTSAVVSAGFQDGDYGGSLTGGSATGLANDATVYTATVTIDGGGPDAISIVGSAAQTYTTLISELDTDTTGATWAINGGELRCTSDTTGEASSVATVDTDLFSTLTDFVSFNTATPGDGEPTFASVGNTVVDATVTWRHVSSRAAFHDVAIVGPSYVLDEWVFVCNTRDAAGDFVLYVDGVEVGRQGPDAADTTPGSFGSPVPRAFTVEYNTVLGDDVALGATNSGSGDPYTGDTAYFFIHRDGAFSSPAVAALYDTAVDIGIN